MCRLVCVLVCVHKIKNMFCTPNTGHDGEHYGHIPFDIGCQLLHKVQLADVKFTQNGLDAVKRHNSVDRSTGEETFSPAILETTATKSFAKSVHV